MPTLEHPLLFGKSEKVYRKLGTAAFIAGIRQPAFGQGEFDREATAQKYRCSIEYVDFEYGLQGTVDVSNRHIQVSYDETEYELDLTVAHELGHVFLSDCGETGLLSLVDTEGFCEHFAHQLVEDRPTLLEGQSVVFAGEPIPPWWTEL